MALFVTKEGKKKSPIAISCFFVDILFLGVFMMAYGLLTEPLHQYLYIVNDLISTVVHCILIALVGTAVCCTLFLVRDKRIVPYSFVGLAIIALMFCMASLQLDTELRSMIFYMILIYGLAPVLVGNLISWTLYWKIWRHSCRTP
ncbi:MAG: hypothetical protein ACRC3H_03515 [Lachnospiraceae bacterium]